MHVYDYVGLANTRWLNRQDLKLLDVQLFLNLLLSVTFNFSLDLEFLCCAPCCSSNLHLLSVKSF